MNEQGAHGRKSKTSSHQQNGISERSKRRMLLMYHTPLKHTIHVATDTALALSIHTSEGDVFRNVMFGSHYNGMGYMDIART